MKMAATTRKASTAGESGISIVTTPADFELRIERIVDAPREKVWRAFTEPDLVAQWWGRGNKLVIEKMEFRPGGKWRYVEHAPHGVHGFFGTYHEITPIERIKYTFAFDGMPGPEGNVMTEFVDLGDGRTKIIDRSFLNSAEEREGLMQSGMLDGANASYDALDRVLAAMK
jgi:uncharacterized protein YndB with AHSA1/START domain